ncbi:MAG: TerC family protein [Alphaproteobacteria bacterium]|nr:TerC family protein [Alphaproteobacteria bacterium]MBU0796516.1 TerC family protein [Alphaproteobacteria bacterium]MBU0888070.1 TerC family protein [Alphaproteobacteria bacterium]MBU1811515.1 TerC family protein [Alphaproteobacteria bacterium]
MIELLSDPQVWIAFATLAFLEIVLGIDNIIFIAIVASRLPEAQRRRARQVGLGLALVMRLALLSVITWIVGLTEPVFTIMGFEASWRDIILFTGGLFLIWKATTEIHGTVEGEHGDAKDKVATSFAAAIGQILVLDVIFSLDSIITAVGMVDDLRIMVAAVIVAVAVMMFAAGPVGEFVQRHQTVKMLALAFLLLVGLALVADGLHFHIPKGYLYFAIGFSILVEALNLAASARRKRKEAEGKAAH